jgi:hypothetical protein
LFALLLLALIILVGADVVNFRNGGSFVLYSIMFLQFSYIYSYGLIVLLRLGEKIIPKNLRKQASNGVDKLASFDFLGKTMVLVQVLSLLAGSVILAILMPLLTDVEFLLARIGFGLKACFIYSCLAGYLYQFQRCIGVIKTVQHGVDGVIQKSGGSRNDLSRAINKMRKNMIE